MSDSVFKNPEAVREQLNLPAVVSYSFVGDSSPSYYARLDHIVQRVAGEENIRQRSFKNSKHGKYTAYRFDIFHDSFEIIEQLYREVMALSGTKFVI